MTQPRVAAFARLANGSVNPERVITGQGSMLGRTIHGLYYDAKHDEIVVPNALADSVLVYRGGANGAEKPIRVIQGCNTQLVTPHSVSFDPVNEEMWVTSLNGHRIVVFRWDANGNAKPLRVISGPKSGVASISSFQIYAQKGWIVAGGQGGFIGVWSIEDNGDVPPRWKIPVNDLTGYVASGIALDPAHKEVLLSCAGQRTRPRSGIANAVLTFAWPEIF